MEFTFRVRVAAISQIEEQLHASSGAISLSLSLFILIQGGVPLLWSALSEFWGRKVRSSRTTLGTGLKFTDARGRGSTCCPQRCARSGA